MKKIIFALCAGLCVMHSAWSTIEDDIRTIQRAYEDFKKERRENTSVDDDKKRFFHFNQTQKNAENHLLQLDTKYKNNLIRYLYNHMPERKEEDKLEYPSTGILFLKKTDQKILESNFLKDSNFLGNDTLLKTIEKAVKELKNNFLINIYFNIYQFFSNERSEKTFNAFITENPISALSNALKVNKAVIEEIAKKSTQEIDDISKKEKEEKIKKEQEEAEKNLHMFGSALKNIDNTKN